MLAEFVSYLLSIAAPHYRSIGALEYSDKPLTLLSPPQAHAVECSTLQGLADLHDGQLDNARTEGNLLVHISSPTEVELIGRISDVYGRRRVWAVAKYPKLCNTFSFGSWMTPESFIIAVQSAFQRVKIENVDGTFAQDLDYVLSVASKISAEQVQSHEDDGIAQRVASRSGVVLKTETLLRPIVNLAPYRTFAEIDQVVSRFVFRARIANDGVNLALFEGDGGRWRLDATAAIAEWLKPKFGDVPVIS